MVRDQGSSDWVTLHKLPLAASNFLIEMNRFCDQVHRDCDGDTSVTVFLPDDDIEIGSVSVIGRTQAARDQHVRRTLARQCGGVADNIVAQFGDIGTNKMAPVCFAQCETLLAAERFVHNFGFRVCCFSTMAETGLDSDPCLMLPHQVERLQRMNSIPKVSYAFRGVVAAMMIAALLISVNIPKPNAVMMARLADAGNVPPQPVYVTLHIAGFEKADETQKKGTDEIAVALNETQLLTTTTDMFRPVLPDALQTAALAVLDLSARRVMPSTQAANYLDAVTEHKGGFHVYVGIQGNFTQLTTGDVGDGQVVHIQKPKAKTYQVARAVQQLQVPAQFSLTEQEIASFSRP